MRRDFATAYPRTFAGAVKETPEALERLRTLLGVRLPEDFVLLSTSLGSGGSGAFSGSKMAAESTLRFRRAVALPPQYLVLDDRNDGGAVLLDTWSGWVLWVSTHALGKVGQAALSAADHDVFDNYESWLAYCAEEVESEL
jgi:hypothetical protein